VTRAGNTLPLPGLPDHTVLAIGSDVLTVATQRVSAGGGYGSFLCSDPTDTDLAGLFITGRTVAAHIEHILAKLGTPTRTLVAVRALRLGHVRAAPAQQHPGIDPHRAGTRQADRRVMCSRLPACRTPT
jgi:hypothetical protein